MSDSEAMMREWLDSFEEVLYALIESPVSTENVYTMILASLHGLKSSLGEV